MTDTKGGKMSSLPVSSSNKADKRGLHAEKLYIYNFPKSHFQHVDRKRDSKFSNGLKVTNPEIELTDQGAGAPYYSRDGDVGIIHIDSSVKDHRQGALALNHEFTHHILTEFVDEEASQKYNVVAFYLESCVFPDFDWEDWRKISIGGRSDDK